MSDLRTAILARAEAAGFPMVMFGGSQVLKGVDGWAQLRSLPQATLPGISAQLELAEEEVARTRATDAASDQLIADREALNAPFSDEEEEERQRFLADAAANAARYDSTEARLGRVEAVLVEIRDALKKR
jgi:hypothetical protein